MERLERVFGLRARGNPSRLSSLFWLPVGALVTLASILVLFWDGENDLLFLFLCNLAIGLSALLRGIAGLLSNPGAASRALRILAEGALPPVYFALFVVQLLVWLV